MNKLLVVLLLISLVCFAQDNTNSYININSNVKNTEIFLNDKKIGIAPIKLYEVNATDFLELLATVDTHYYQKNIKRVLKVEKNTVPTYNIKFEKADAKIFFVGVDAELYINDKFIKVLHESNRIVTVQADKNVSIRLEKDDAKAVFFKDIKANELNTVKYELTTTPLEIRLYTATIGDLMWEDTKDAASTSRDWEKAKVYCNSLEFAQFNDFRLPTIEELDELYENKDKIYNGYGGVFYWSSSTFRDNYKVWDYSVVKNFDDGLNSNSIKEFKEAKVRCVRDLSE